MHRTLVLAILAAGVAPCAHADVTVRQSVNSKGLGQSGDATSVTYIKGMKMRTDTTIGGTTRTTIFDVDAQKMYIFDSKKKEADVWDMQAFSSELSKNVRADEMTVSLKPNGQSKAISGKTAAGYDMDISVPTAMGGDKGMKMTVSLTGPMWIVKGAPGTADYMRFYKGAVEKGWIFSDPRAAKGSPGQAKAMAEMYKQLAAAGGVAYETDMTIKVSGDGPMAGLMAKMGGMAMTSVVDSVETASVDDALFAAPAGYKLNQKK